MSAEVFVCHAGTCRARGAEAVLVEIEELAEAVGADCKVRESGCLGLCSQAPNAVVRTKTGRTKVTEHTRLTSLEASAKVVERATGVAPDLGATNWRLEGLRAERARSHAKSVYHWNAALRGLKAPAFSDPELRQLRADAGYPDGITAAAPSAIAGYTRWTLEEVNAVSRHSALFSFRSKDLKRGTPHPRGRGRQPVPITWHTTLLALVGANGEGPLPWVERDYTPVSTARDWERGTVDLLVKVYADGLATSWLKTVPVGAEVWLSKPVKTLDVPALVADGGRAFRPASVLLLLAGTGCVALPQILAHRDPMTKLSISTPKRDQLKVPVDVVLSCRADDPLLVEDVAAWCAEEGDAAGLRNATVLVTPEGAGPPQFDAAAKAADAVLAASPNAAVVRARLDGALLREAYARMPQPCRVVVSGPDGFNAACRSALLDLVDDADDVTILAA